MSWFAAGIVFAVVWWLVLFMVLPFGASPPDEVEPGMATSAPAKPRIGLKFLITTLIALVVTALVLWLIDSGLIQLRPTPQAAGFVPAKVEISYGFAPIRDSTSGSCRQAAEIAEKSPSLEDARAVVIARGGAPAADGPKFVSDPGSTRRRRPAGWGLAELLGVAVWMPLKFEGKAHSISPKS
jgi:predicted secreted protein